MAGQTYPDVTKSSAKTQEDVEVYRHPQGKIATIRNGILTVTKNGKLTKSSATIDNLRNGHGRWVRDDSAAVAEPQKPGLNPKPGRLEPAVAKVSDKRELTPREQAIIRNGYPVDTKLDPSKPIPLEDRSPEITHHPRAVLPTKTRFNPHTAGAGNEYVEIWNKGDSSTSYLIVSSESNGKETHRIIAGWKANENTALGDTFPLEHDQTGARIGDRSWKVTGAFEGKDGGRTAGTIPNKSIPLYTYK